MSDDAFKRAKSLIERMMEGYPEFKRRQLLNSHCLASPEEKKARLKLVQALSVELAAIRKQDRFVLFGESAIECVMEGDWNGVADRMGWLTFSDENLEYRQHMAPIWAKFREMLQVACVEARHRQESELKEFRGEKEDSS